MFDERILRKGLKASLFGNRIYAFATIDSTNSCAKAIAGCGATEGTVVISEQQTAGRGRLGRLWESAPNQNLMFSVVLRPNVPPEGLNLLPLYVAVAVSQAIERTTGLKVECKWPNDILFNGKKLAGILIEASIKQNMVEYVVIGIGVNVNQQAFDADLSTRATSLRLLVRKEVDRVALFQEMLHQLEQNYRSINASGFHSVIPQWLSRSTMVNKEIAVSQQGEIISGIVKGLSPEGGLVLQTNGSEKTVYAGDVTVVRM
jgi:BirA family biotin operon repressor/biotin-[acetyl-CoA-carboxylase] ligase